MSGPEHLDWLFARQRFGVRPGLERVHALLAALGRPQDRFRAILVGGTNGKGSTAATLASVLRAAGERTGLFTSPHLTRFSERFVVDGQELPAGQVLAALGRVRPLAETYEASFFEVVTALGCLLFAEAEVQTAVMEVGLGGRLDATNALDPVLSLLTNVGLDHTAILGDTVQAIAAEKAGILRAGRPALTGASPDLWPVLDGAGAELWAAAREWRWEAESLGWEGHAVEIQTPAGDLSFRTPLLGRHGAGNAALAAAAALRLGLPAGAVREGAAGTRWPGRLERLPWRGGQVLLDGAHNPDGAQAVAAALADLGTGPLPLIFGAAEDKDLEGVAAALRPLASRVILTRAALSPRAAEPHTLARLFPDLPLTLTRTPEEALGALPPGAQALACGSLYLVGELRPLLLGEVGEARERWQ
ncbi:bifunctional folylpolyglutamate synthase/dihydrofolate synthase [uncultured Deinococcus sp.]|uniref:bifunctional folylpolyglutamate synthase/dihydrofolate synthase n=1 Tax=uncultured Deinococcus sp. TaxID=158789 RepID=UPI00374A32ED